MKHFHLSQGDKLAGLDGPLYLQKKIKSVLTLAPFIGNTCRLVIVLNSISSWAAPHWVALAIFALAWDGRGICMEFLPNSRGSARGHSLAKMAEEGYSVSMPPGGKHFPLIARGLPPVPLAPSSYQRLERIKEP